MHILLLFTIAYLLGAIPFGYLIAKLWKLDIRQHGSGNIGATNVFRTLGPLPGTLVFLLDMFKGAIAIQLALSITDNAWLVILTGLVAVLGHSFTIFLKFKGGRGVATALGVLLAIAPDIFLGAAIMVVLIIFFTRYVSLASMITPFFVTAAFFILGRPLPYGLMAGIITLFIVIRHIPNIKRLRSGTELRI